MKSIPVTQAERRGSPRRQPTETIGVARTVPVLPLTDAQVLNVSATGVALRTAVPVRPGERLSFTVNHTAPPILAEVLAVEPMDDEQGSAFRVRCRCLLGGFDEA